MGVVEEVVLSKKPNKTLLEGELGRSKDRLLLNKDRDLISDLLVDPIIKGGEEEEEEVMGEVRSSLFERNKEVI